MTLFQLRKLCQKLDPKFQYEIRGTRLYIEKDHQVLTCLDCTGRPHDFNDQHIKHLTDRQTVGRLRNLITRIFIQINAWHKLLN